MDLASIQRVAGDSGGIVYLMAVMLLVGLTVIIERSYYFWKINTQGQHVMMALEGSETLDQGLLDKLGGGFAHTPHCKVVKTALDHNLNHDFDRISDKLDESIMREAPSIDRFLWILDTIVTMAPLLGLLGTIIGMFNAFQVLGTAGGEPTKITGGVAEALIATASGLFIAIIGLFFFNALNNRVRIIMHQLETIKKMLLNRMYHHYPDMVTERAINERVTLKGV
ncbi:MotA/TolQ/ExbB proton channel family protein [Ferrovum sp. PN-J185]|uniref:MotA/TolQ/ExbB proton channel family protein n=1 Tax=Ferrovum sp. PN-J185 TaxID=1356306 RepID=UPI000792E810|nr:MotA/TolQ/ExbB proton channel family protein [Ferrovum sp. PN-J185]KXW56394.1 biopolymer transport protein ExbB [Ferrovum sp. PN-J185]MCC6069117.1 MotA/TolQ/ExbB proton channel family protein [Ferrovum sp. PN-J185]MDE1890902.1 MotA/TolQ/ExbB proton channel family protein [Betaproteobacteria bacterium]MDE2055786.1 MotA/TolQ/ExbB proton channel family protein [Betaproteobacteria bacterium]